MSLDLPTEAEHVEKEPQAFLARHPAPVIIDEVQYAPALFRHLKGSVDAARKRNGQFLLRSCCLSPISPTELRYVSNLPTSPICRERRNPPPRPQPVNRHSVPRPRRSGSVRAEGRQTTRQVLCGEICRPPIVRRRKGHRPLPRRGA